MKMEGYLYELKKEVGLITGLNPFQNDDSFFEDLLKLRSNSDREVSEEVEDSGIYHYRFKTKNRGFGYSITVGIDTTPSPTGTIYRVVILDELA